MIHKRHNPWPQSVRELKRTWQTCQPPLNVMHPYAKLIFFSLQRFWVWNCICIIPNPRFCRGFSHTSLPSSAHTILGVNKDFYSESRSREYAEGGWKLSKKTSFVADRCKCSFSQLQMLQILIWPEFCCRLLRNRLIACSSSTELRHLWKL